MFRPRPGSRRARPDTAGLFAGIPHRVGAQPGLIVLIRAPRRSHCTASAITRSELPRGSYGHDFNKIVDPSEVVRVMRVEGQLDEHSRGN